MGQSRRKLVAEEFLDVMIFGAKMRIGISSPAGQPLLLEPSVFQQVGRQSG